MQARGSSHVDVSNRLSVLILIEARIFRTIRVEFLALLLRNSIPRSVWS